MVERDAPAACVGWPSKSDTVPYTIVCPLGVQCVTEHGCSLGDVGFLPTETHCAATIQRRGDGQDCNYACDKVGGTCAGGADGGLSRRCQGSMSDWGCGNTAGDQVCHCAFPAPAPTEAPTVARTLVCWGGQKEDARLGTAEDPTTTRPDLCRGTRPRTW